MVVFFTSCHHNKELQLSSFDVIEAWTKVWISDVDKYSFILAIFLKWKKQFLQMLVICFSIDICWSRVTPMFRAEVLGIILELDTSICSIAGPKRFRAFITSSSVLFQFNFNLFLTIHKSISFTHVSICTSAPNFPSLVDSKARYSRVSSA